MSRSIASILLPAIVAVTCATVRAQQVSEPTRGQMLYATHCIACHTSQIHWRDKKESHDWESLKTQVRRWQAAALLQWSDDDISEVARHLNDTIYRFPPPANRMSRAAPPLQAAIKVRTKSRDDTTPAIPLLSVTTTWWIPRSTMSPVTMPTGVCGSTTIGL